MPQKSKPEQPLSRKSSMVNIWVGKQLGPELDHVAAREAEISGRATTRIDLVRELVIWAYGIYKQVGSLRALKLLRAEDFVNGKTKKGPRLTRF